MTTTRRRPRLRAALAVALAILAIPFVLIALMGSLSEKSR